MKNKDMLYKICAAFVTAGLFVAFYGIYQQIFGISLDNAWIDDDMFSQNVTRVYSTLENPNVLGEYLLFVIPLCASLLWTRKTFLSRLYYFGALGCSTLCMIFTQSRGCWLGLILAVAIFALLVDKRLVYAGIAGLFLLPFVLPESIIMRFMSIGNLADSSTSYRVYIWLGTLRMLEGFGLYGLGLGTEAFNKIYPFYSYNSIIAPHAHNIYLQILVEMGAIGLFVLAFVMIKALKKTLLGYISDKKGLCGILSVGVIAGIFGFMLQGAFDYVWYNYRVFLIFWMFITIGIATKEVQGDRISSHN